MDLERLESTVQRMIVKGAEGVLEALSGTEAANDELAWAAGTLAGRESLGVMLPDDIERPWA